MRLPIFTFIFLLWTELVLALPPTPLLQQAATKVLREMPVKLYEGSATENDLQACLRLIELATNDNAKRPFALLVAQYHRIALQKPERTLAMIVPMLTGKKSDAFDLEKPPPIKDWTINEQTALFAVEAAHCLAALDKPQLAIEIIDAVGQKYEDETRVLAAECGADLFVRTKMYEKAVEFHGFALNVLETLKQKEYEPGKGERIFFSEEQQIIRNRLTDKRLLAQRMFDEDRFGTDWVAYRNAQRLHFAGRYLEAYFSYMNIVDQYRDSIYGEAATCYLIGILCKMADRENIKDAAETFKSKQKELETAKQMVRVGIMLRDPETIMERRREIVTNLEKMISLWRSMPLGEKAIVAAEKYTEQFLERESFGLYRGEAMLNCGLCRLETFLDPDKAEPWLLRANNWFDEVKKTDAALLKLEVPDKSKAVSQPPREERFTDEWSNVKLSQPKPGDLFNRRECKWYLSSKQKDATLWLGMIAYAKQDYDNAGAWWKYMYVIDPYFEEAEKGPFGSTPQRLLWNVENNKGALYATPREMAVFRSPRLRLMVFTADLEMENANLTAAEAKFRRLLADREIQANREMSAYCSYVLAVALFCQFKRQEGEAILEKFVPGKPFEGTVVAPRALLHYANSIQDIHDPQRFSRKMKCYEYIVANYPKSDEADFALFYQAEPFYYLERYADAIPRLQAYLKKYPKGKFAEVAKEFLRVASEQGKI